LGGAVFAHIDKSKGYLFCSYDLGQVLENQKKALRDEVEKIEPNRLLNTAPADLAKYLEQKFRLASPHLRREEWTVDTQETRIDVSHDSMRAIFDRSKPFYIPGQRFDVEIPFDGEPELFYCQPSTSTMNPPRAQVHQGKLIITYQVTHDSQRDVRPEIDRTVADIEQYLGWIRSQVDAFNNELPAVASSAIQNRRDRLLRSQGRVAVLGIPIKPRADAPRTYAVPTVKKKIAPTLPAAPSVPYEPEPVLDMQLYDHILSVIQNMAQVIERSPSAFKSMGEEDLRQHFLVQLNGQFEGAASAETFNVSGKTDILLREKGRNVFIAECKFWKGPKVFREAIDQLLGYTSWRDTKTAILVFTKGTALSTVLGGIRGEVESYPTYKRTVHWAHETGARYILHQRGDPNRELLLTVLVFEIPG
jgi:hypothetical protein